MCPISGYPEFLPEEQKEFNKTKDMIRDCFESNKFCPIETPAVELLETLVAKGVDHEIYGIHRLADPETPKKIGLRYDLTTPLMRYVKEHQYKLKFPFHAYQIGPVWRGERPQAGRYRQFYQCDIDTILKFNVNFNNLEKFNFAEVFIPLVHETINIITTLQHTLCQLLDSKDFKFEINNIGDSVFESYLDFVIRGLNSRCIDINIEINPNLTRGLTYYNGIVFEVFCGHDEYKKSICSGGIYPFNEHFGKHFIGIGGSIGLSRIWSMRPAC